jgi:hypothetical protein
VTFLDDYLNRLRGAPVLGGALDLARQEFGPLMGGPGGLPVVAPRSAQEIPIFAATGPAGLIAYRKSRLLPEELGGALLAAAGHAPYTDPALSAAAAQLREAGAVSGPPDVRFRAVNAAAAREAPIPATVLNAILDPQSYVNPGGGAARPAAQLAERAAPEAATVVRGLLGPGTQAAERAVPEAEAVASRLAADVPPPPPTMAAPPRAPLTARTPELARDMLLDALGQAPLPARARAIGALNAANFPEGGMANAMRAVTGGATIDALGDLERPYTNYLLQRTIENPDAIAALRDLHPGLHAVVDMLPDLPERTALDLQNEVRRAAGLPEKVVKPARAPKAAAVEPTPAPPPVHPELLNADGTPKTLYHGTSATFGDFAMRPGAFGTGAYFTDSPFMSTIYALGEEGGTRSLDGVLRGAEPAPNIRPAHLALRNPFLWPDDPAAEAALQALGPDELTARLRAQGYDGVVVKNPVNPHYTEYVAFDPGQIKSPYGAPTAPETPAQVSEAVATPPVAPSPPPSATGGIPAGGDVAAGGMGGAPTMQAALPEAPPDLRPGAVPPDQLATINRLMEHHPNTGANEDRALYDALRAEALRRGIPEAAIARAEAAIPDTLRRQFTESPQLIRDRIAEIEASPEGRTFKYINPQGQFKLVDIRTGRPIALRGAGGKLRQSAEAPWNIPGTHYDEVAASALGQRLGPDAVDTTNLDDFFTRARDMWRERRDLRAQLGEATRATGSYTETAGMGGQAPIQFATTLAGAAGGGLAGYRAAGDEASPTDRAAATLAGAAAGGTAGHLGPALLARPGESALRGIAAAGGGPVELAARGILGGDVAGKVLPFAREEAMAQHAAGSQVQALLPRLRQMGGIWARNVTQTARNALQDETWLQFVLRGLQPGAAGELGTVRRAMADRLRLGTEWERYPTTTTGPLQAAGITDATLNLGQTFHGTEGYLNEVLSNTQNAIGEAGLSALNPVRAAMNPLSVGFAGAKGYARNFQSGLFKAVNQFQQLSARHAVFADEFTSRLAQAADRFLPDLERRGYDVTPLRQKLAAEGAFSPDDVRTAMLGDNPAVQAWERTVASAQDAAEGRARKLLGDYSRRGVIERKAGGVVPFVSWQLRAWPVMAEMLATHPGAALAVGNLLRLSGQQVTANKEPIRNVGTIPIATPAGTVRLNPLSAVAPGSPEMLTLGSEDPNAPEDRTAYQTASDLLQKVGLGFGPGMQALAYATSQDYKGPGPLSRTAGIENAIGQVPFVQLPSLGAAGLDAARLLLRQPIERVSAGPGLPVAGVAQPDYDPNLRRAQEVYYDATGKAIGQPGTAAGAAQTLDPNSPLMSRARGDVATSGALRNALSLVLPVGVQAQTPEAGKAQRARARVPFSRAELDRLRGESPLLSQLAQRRNAQYQAANPVAALYEANTPTERKLAILHDWDRAHSGLLVDRKVFLARRQQVLDTLGLKENATTRFDIAELAAPAR